MFPSRYIVDTWLSRLGLKDVAVPVVSSKAASFEALEGLFAGGLPRDLFIGLFMGLFICLFIGIGLVGGLLPFFITSQLISAVSRAAAKMVEEVRRQFKETPEILTGKTKPDYAKCVDVATVASLRELWKSATITIATPIILGVILGPTAVAGVLMGAVVTGLFLAYHLANSGGAWDNAKKYLEIQGMKGTEEHKITIVGDVIGDPYKDTAGPALNTVIKLLNTVSIVFVSAFIAILAL